MLLAVLGAIDASAQPATPGGFSFVVVSDLHYGLVRSRFRGDTLVPAARVNAAMAETILELPKRLLPADGGIGASQPVGPLAFVAITGDVTNRAEGGAQSATASWNEFLETFAAPLANARVGRVPVYAAVGNHDASNAIGYNFALDPPTDTGAMVGLLALADPAGVAKRPPFEYARDRVHYVRHVEGLAIMFLHIWPDSGERSWMERELASIPDSVPVLLFAHDPPVIDHTHFIAPDGGPPGHLGFQALLSERWSGAMPTAGAAMPAPLDSVRAFVRRHPNLRAYFHGHQNWTEYYALRDESGADMLPAFRVDSPLKGRDSATDESKLALLLVTVAADHRRLTVREYKWDRSAAVAPWGAARSIELRP